MENSTLTTAPTLPKKQLMLLRLEYFSFALVPVALIYFGLIPKRWEYLFSTLLVMSLISIWALNIKIKKHRFTWARAGMTRNLKKGINLYVIAILAAVACFFVAPYFTRVRTDFNTDTMLWFTILGSSLQELLFRAYLWTLGTLIFTPKVNFIANVSVFALMHVFYDDLIIVMPPVIFFGILLTWLFKKNPNVAWAALTHIVYGALAVYLFIFG